MLDINLYGANLEITRKKLEQRAFPLNVLDRFNELDERRRALIHERDELNATRNRESQGIGTLMKPVRKMRLNRVAPRCENSGPNRCDRSRVSGGGDRFDQSLW